MINIYDYETLSNDLRTAPVVSVAAMSVDEGLFLSKTPYTYIDLVDHARQMKFNVKDQVGNYGRIIDKGTLDWWKQQGPDAFKQLAPSEDDHSIEDLPNFLRSVLSKGALIYSRGNAYDPVLTTSIFDMLGQSEPYSFRDVRDTRSFIEGIAVGHGLSIKNSFIPMGVPDGGFVAHNPSHDIAMDIYRIQSMLRRVSFGEPL